MSASTEDVDATSLMVSLGMTRINGGWKWNKDPLTAGSAKRLPLPLPKSVADCLSDKTAEAAAAKMATMAKERQDKQAKLDNGNEPAGPFSPTYEEAGLIPPIGIPVGGLDEDPSKRLSSLDANWQDQLWPGLEQIVIRNLRVAAFSSAWKDVLPLFQAQYAEYLVNPIVVVDDPAGTSVETTALLISPRTVSGRVPALDAADLMFTVEELRLARGLPQRFLEYHMEAAASLLDKARQLQIERENKAALAASFALDTVQFLVEDQRQRTDIASGVTVAPVLGAMGEWSRSAREAHAMSAQSALLESRATSLLANPSESANAAARLAYATAWMQTVLYGPEVVSLTGGTRVRSDEIKDAALAAAQMASAQQGILLRGQATDLNIRAEGAKHQAAAERERAAAAVHSAYRAILRVNDLARITNSKLLMACTPGGALNYAQHEQRIRLEYLATLRAGLLRLASCAEGLYSILGYDIKMPGVVAHVLPTGTIPASMVESGRLDDEARPDEVLLNASLWLRDATNWFLTKMRLERRWVRVVRLRQFVLSDVAWNEAMANGELAFELDAGVLGAVTLPRLRGVALEVLPSTKMPDPEANRYFTARLTFPRTVSLGSAEQMEDRMIGRIRRVNSSLPPPVPELTDYILNANPLGAWGVKIDPTAALDDVYLHLWLAEA